MGVVQVGLWVPTPLPWCSPTYGVLALPRAVLSALACSACVSLGWHERLAVVRDFALCACVCACACVYICWSLVGFDDGIFYQQLVVRDVQQDHYYWLMSTTVKD